MPLILIILAGFLFLTQCDGNGGSGKRASSHDCYWSTALREEIC